MKNLSIILLLFLSISCKTDKNTEENNVEETTTVEKNTTVETPTFYPIQHATFVMNWGEDVLYVDPTGGKESFEKFKAPTLILVTDIHGDHYNVETLLELSATAKIIAPKAVFDMMPEELKVNTSVLANAQTIDVNGFSITGVAMYNLTEERKNFHQKGRGNGYIVSKDNYQVYISGDTEDVPEMKNLKNIDVAFVCMNLPYTMTPEAAADAVLAFTPQKVIPYHYRGMLEGKRHFFDVENFKNIVNNSNKNIEVELLEWYPEQ